MANKKSDQSLNNKISFLNTILNKQNEFAQHIDNQTHIIVGLSSAIFLFSASQIRENNEIILSFLILAIFSIISALIGLFAVHPPKFMRKQDQPESLMYNRKIYGFPSSKKYGKELSEQMKNTKTIIQQYTKEIYNISRYYYRPKRRLFHVSRNILIIGFFLSFLSFLIEIY